jgi:putative transposase
LCESEPDDVGKEDSTTMKRHRHTPEQIIRKLAEGEKLLGEGKPIEEVARHLEITESTWHRWRNHYGAMKAKDAKRLKELEKENGRLKKIVADQALHIDMLRELNRGNF